MKWKAAKEPQIKIRYIILFFLLSIPSSAEVQFVDTTTAAGITFRHVDGRTGEKYLIETLGSGALFFDFNADGALDLYVVNATHIPPPTSEKTSQIHPTLPQNKLYRNNGNSTFTDITDRAGVGDTGYGVGCAAADVNNDGYPEIYVTNYGRNRLYSNNGDGTFKDVTQKAGVGDERWGTSCAFLDYDLDGDVDLYVVNYMKFSIAENEWWETQGIRTYCSPTDQIAGSHFVSEPDILYRNNGDGTFTDVTKTAGILHRALGLAVAVGDYDNNGYPDLHIANDMEADLFYHNNGDGTFTETADFTGTGYDENGFPGSGMGNAFGDYNNDGYLDLVVSNASGLPALLYRNENAAFFTDVSFVSGIGAVTLPYFKWAVEFLDYDNDGLLDLFVANGHLQANISLFSESTYPQMDVMFRNVRRQDGTHHFTDTSTEVGLAALRKKVSRAAAFGDYDNDGDIDIFLNNANQHATLLRNEGGNSNHWLTLQPIGTQSNTSGIGTKIVVKAGNLSLTKEARSGASYLSQSDLRVHFGLGKNSAVETLEIHWQSGLTEQFSHVKSNQILRVKEGHGIINNKNNN